LFTTPVNIVTRSEDLWHQGGAVGDAALLISIKPKSKSY